jgi:hypothetical protein
MLKREELRCSVEGRCHRSLEAKQARVEDALVALAADPVRVQQLCGWSWICHHPEQLPLGFKMVKRITDKVSQLDNLTNLTGEF